MKSDTIMAGGNGSRVIQVTNIAPQATKDQMQTLFGHIGKIEEIRLYPTIRDVACPVPSRICYVKYADSSCVPVAQHLTNTVFIDRALIVIPVLSIPDEYRALEMSKNGTIVPGLQKPDSKLPPEIINRIEGQSPQQIIKTYDPKLVENNLPEYPALPSFYDARKVEEIRRTILVCDVPNEWRLDDLMEYFQRAGEVKYARWAEKDERTFCMIEFCEQVSIINALKMHGNDFKGGTLNVYHATDSISKPEAKSNEAAQAEIAEAMSIVKEAQSMISAAIDPVIGMLAKDKRRRSRSRTHSRDRHASRSHSERSSSRRRTPVRSKSSKSRSHRSHSRKRKTHSHSRSRSHRKSHSHKRSRSKSRSHKRSRSHHKRSIEKHSRSSHSHSHSKRHTPSPTCDDVSHRRRSHKKSRSRHSPSVERKHKSYKDDSMERKSSRSSTDSKSRKSVSREKSENMDISNSP